MGWSRSENAEPAVGVPNWLEYNWLVAVLSPWLLLGCESVRSAGFFRGMADDSLADGEPWLGSSIQVRLMMVMSSGSSRMIR